MDRFLLRIKKYIPTALFTKLQPIYHYVMGFVAAVVYGFPSRNMIVVGVTGTTGKTTVVYMIAHLLQHAGVKVGYTSTAMFCDGEREWLNDKKMTMLGRFFTQKMLRQMVTNGCHVAIVETTSEGAVQFRHRFINYDIFVFTGLYPEHIDAHGSFDNYKKAKLSLFSHLARSRTKSAAVVNALARDLHFHMPTAGTAQDHNAKTFPKTIIVNGDNEHANDFLTFPVPQKLLFTQEERVCRGAQRHDVTCVPYRFVETMPQGVCMLFDGADVQLALLGEFTATNAATAGCVGRALGLKLQEITAGLESIMGIPGRLEKIPNDRGMTIIVDYAFEPVAVTKLYETIVPLGSSHIVHVLGSCGGGRDVARREALGRLAGERADTVIVTNEDPYDDDPRAIMEMVADGARAVGKVDGQDLFIIPERRDGIAAALRTAPEGAIVLITGKGSEQAIVVADGVKVPWDDRSVVREELEKL